MRIATWNMGRRKGAWDYLQGVIDPDYALLQETLRPRGPTDQWRWDPIGGNSAKYGEAANYRWGSAVWSRDHPLEALTLGVPSGWIQIARTTAGKSLSLISLHVELDREGR